MPEPQKKRPPEFIFFERYDTLTSFGFDNFEQRISSADITVKIFHILAGKNYLVEKTQMEMTVIPEQISESAPFKDTIELLQIIQSLNPGIKSEFLLQKNYFETSDLSAFTILQFDEDKEGRVRFLGSMNGRKREMLSGILFSKRNYREILPADSAEWALNLQKDIHLKVFVSHVCPSCPPAAIVCGALAAISPHIHTDIIDVKDFKDLADRFSVIGLPRVVVNDDKSFVADSGPKRLVSDIRNACE